MVGKESKPAERNRLWNSHRNRNGNFTKIKNIIWSLNLNNRRLNCAEITNANRQELRSNASDRQNDEIIKANTTPSYNNLTPAHEPEPTTIYYKIIKGWPFEVVQSALRDCLPSRALLWVDFIGFLILNKVTYRKLQNRVQAALKIMDIIRVPNVTRKREHNGR